MSAALHRCAQLKWHGPLAGKCSLFDIQPLCAKNRNPHGMGPSPANVHCSTFNPSAPIIATHMAWALTGKRPHLLPSGTRQRSGKCSLFDIQPLCAKNRNPHGMGPSPANVHCSTLKVSWKKREVQTRALRSLRNSRCEATSLRSSLGSVKSDRELLREMARLI
jgi:hypothetical protein